MRFFVTGQPIPKARPRVTREGHAYTPARTTAWEEAVGWAAKVAMKSENPYQGPVRVRLEFVGARANADSDNLAKAVLDGMNKIVYLDDHQVISLHVERFPAGDPYGPQRKGVDIGVEEVA